MATAMGNRREKEVSDLLRQLAGAAIEVGEYSGEWWTKEQLVPKKIDGASATFIAAASPDVVLDLIADRDIWRGGAEEYRRKLNAPLEEHYAIIGNAARLVESEKGCRIWQFDDAPGNLKRLSEFGGDEEILMVLPQSATPDELEYWTWNLNRWAHGPQVVVRPETRDIVLIFAH